MSADLNTIYSSVVSINNQINTNLESLRKTKVGPNPQQKEVQKKIGELTKALKGAFTSGEVYTLSVGLEDKLRKGSDIESIRGDLGRIQTLISDKMPKAPTANTPVVVAAVQSSQKTTPVTVSSETSSKTKKSPETVVRYEESWNVRETQEEETEPSDKTSIDDYKAQLAQLSRDNKCDEALQTFQDILLDYKDNEEMTDHQLQGLVNILLQNRDNIDNRCKLLEFAQGSGFEERVGNLLGFK